MTGPQNDQAAERLA
jgi:hypothetical protein